MPATTPPCPPADRSDRPLAAPADPPGRRVLERSFASVEAGALWDGVRAESDAVLRAGGVFVLLARGAAAVGDPALLAPAEVQRRARLRRRRDGEQLVLGRTLIHRLVAPAGADGPCSLEYGAHGKPFLRGAAEFNLSHSGAVVACALCARGPVGIDVEAFEHLREIDELLPRILHPRERQALDAAPAAQRRALFERCWTRKEAVVKFLGAGLVQDLCAIDVQPADEQPGLEAPAHVQLADLDARACTITGAVAMPAGTRLLAVRLLDLAHA